MQLWGRQERGLRGAFQLVQQQDYSPDRLLRAFRRQPEPQATMARDLGLLALRITTGALLAGHGAQKLFGTFNGPGVEKTAGHMESMGLKPGKNWAALAGASELGGGVLTALGLATPLGLLGVAGSMAMAIEKVHPLNKPIWVTEGGAELPLTNLAIVAALELAGPGRYSLDTALGLRIPRWVTLGGVALMAGVVIAGALNQPDNDEAQESEAQAKDGSDEVVETSSQEPKASKSRGKQQPQDVAAASKAVTEDATRQLEAEEAS